MRILHICGYTVERGGASKVVYDHSKFQINASHEVSILSIDFPNEEPYPLAEGVKLIKVRSHWLGKFMPDFSTESLAFFKKFRNDFDIIQIHGIWFWGSIAPFFTKTKAKRIYTIHGMLSEWTMNQGRLKKTLFGMLFQKRCLRLADAIFVLTNEEKKELLNFEDSLKNIYVIPNAVYGIKRATIDEKNVLRQELNISQTQKVVLFLSRIHKKKGVELLLQAFSNLNDKKVILIFAGPDDGEVENLKEIIAKKGISNQVIFTGSVSGRKKEVLFSIADVYALTSFSEGFPMAVLEALELGVPVLVSDQTRIDFFINKYNAGKVVNLNTEQITQGLKEILTNNSLAQTFIENGHQMIKNEFQPDAVFAKTLEIYQEVLNKNS